jgi:hypothetical protein
MTLAAIILAVLTLGLTIPVFWVASMMWAGVAASNMHTYQVWLRGHMEQPSPLPPPPPSRP